MRCLFTDVELPSPQRLEHAPPRSLGGGFGSRSTTSSEFNSLSGRFLEPELVKCFETVLLQLTPGMRSELADKEYRVVGANDQGEYLLRPGGSASRKKLETTTHWPDGKPRVEGPSLKAVRKYFRDRNGRGTPLTIALERFQSGSLQIKSQVTSLAAEVAILKSLLVAFDIAYDCSQSSWVRGEHTRMARDFVARFVSAAAMNVDVELLTEGAVTCRGIEFGEREQILRSARRVHPGVGPLDHVLVAIGDPTRRCIYGSWLIFGYEPWRFRLSSNYTGPAFCHLIGCNPMKHGGVWGPYETWADYTFEQRGLSHWRVKGSLDIKMLERLVLQERARLAGIAFTYANLLNPVVGPRWCMMEFFVLLKEGAVGMTVGTFVREALLTYWPDRVVEPAMAATLSHNVLEYELQLDGSVREDETPAWSFALYELLAIVVRHLVNSGKVPTMSRIGTGPTLVE